MKIQVILIIASITGAYGIWLWQIFDKKATSKPSSSSLLLWSIIDIIMLVNTIRAKNDLTLILSYTIATVALTAIVLVKGQFKWDKKQDTFVAIVAAICLIISYLTSPIVGVICGALSISVAGIPNMMILYKAKINTLSSLNIFFFMSGPMVTISFLNSFELKEIIYPGIAMLYWCISFLVYLLPEKEEI